MLTLCIRKSKPDPQDQRLLMEQALANIVGIESMMMTKMMTLNSHVSKKFKNFRETVLRFFYRVKNVNHAMVEGTLGLWTCMGLVPGSID